MEKYLNRTEAGRVLALELKKYADRKDVIVLALPRGGVPVAYEIAALLHLPLDIFIVRKLGVPGHEEFAMGAIASGDVCVLNDETISDLSLTPDAIHAVMEKEKRELMRRETVYRGGRPFPVLKDKTIILVDDGIATGASMRAAIKALYAFDPASLIIAVPVAEKMMCESMQLLVDKFICPLRPVNFYAVGAWYEDFSQTEDEEVFTLLQKTRKKP
jgi:predicted phosphoribosyltransferase